ncbi:MAG: 3-phosphoshikimate 1-carboxyvinyltransferase [Candidatus Latescibacterota bacterium]|nr:MAG: 3-phosphoshikimate 1-carboxyvinyltransferase [Candidatus Latescibacterota bacterium]
MSESRLRFDAGTWRIVGPLRPAGTLAPPGDKSIAHRVLLMAALSNGECRLGGVPNSADVACTAAALRRMGVRIQADGAEWRVTGVGFAGLHPPAGDLDCGNSGTTMRLLCGALAAQAFPTRLSGDESLRRRPMRRVAEPLRRMGARIACLGAQERPPVQIEPAAAPLRGAEHTLEVDSAQVRSAILLAALRASGRTRIRPAGVARDHTERLLHALGARVIRTPESITLHPLRGQTSWNGFDVQVPGDLSSAAFFVAWCAASAHGSLRCVRVGLNPGRACYLEILRRAGARIEITSERQELGEPSGAVRVAGPLRAPLQLAGADVVQCIDEVPALLAAAAVAGVPAQVHDAGELRVKESDRIAALAQLLRAFGACVHESRDGLQLEACAALHPAQVDSYGDHRIAMAAAVLAACAPGESRIDNVDCVRTSYPRFPDDLERLARV